MFKQYSPGFLKWVSAGWCQWKFAKKRTAQVCGEEPEFCLRHIGFTLPSGYPNGVMWTYRLGRWPYRLETWKSRFFGRHQLGSPQLVSGLEAIKPERITQKSMQHVRQRETSTESWSSRYTWHKEKTKLETQKREKSKRKYPWVKS